MRSVPCPAGDKGLCTIPDRTAVVEQGTVSVKSRADIESSYPNLDLDKASLIRLEAPVDDGSLIETVDEGGAQAERIADFAASALRESGAEAAVVVNCSCGHCYMAEV